MNTFATDRRLARRHNVAVALTHRLWKSGIPAGLGRSLNISEGGIYFATRSAIECGDIIEVRFTMPAVVVGEPPAEWLCTGLVLRVDRAGEVRGLGVRFDHCEIARPLGTTTIYEARSLSASYAAR